MFFTPRFILLVVPSEKPYLTIPFVCHDVSANSIKEKAVVANNYGTSCKIEECILKRSYRINICENTANEKIGVSVRETNMRPRNFSILFIIVIPRSFVGSSSCKRIGREGGRIVSREIEKKHQSTSIAHNSPREHLHQI
jgi:hypothetical protein